MSSLKIAVLGAASYVFGPSVLTQAFFDHGFTDVEFALMDPDREGVELMAALGRRMAEVKGLEGVSVTAHTERLPALDGADFVLHVACVGLNERAETDREIIRRHMPHHTISEFGGVAGISYSLRQIALTEGIAADMRKVCPGAWLLCLADPLPRVAQAAHECGVKTVGFCAASLEGYDRMWRILNGGSLDYPYTEAREEWDVTAAGLNHFSWVLDLRSRATGEDMMPKLRRALKEGAASGSPRSDALSLETGYLLLPNDASTKDFLPPRPGTTLRAVPAHGGPVERDRRRGLLKVLAEGRGKWDDLLRYGAWERPVDLIAAMAYGKPVSFHALNLVNTGQIPNLPQGVFVETPGYGTSSGPRPDQVTLPASVLPYCEGVARVTDTIVRVARERSLKRLYEAVELDPTVLDKREGKLAVEECLRAHADLLPAYS